MFLVGSTVVCANDYLNGSKKVEGKNVAVIGGGITGAETALELNGEGKNVTVVEMADRFLANPGSSCQAYSITIAQSDIKIMTGKRLVAVDDKEITLTDRWGNENKVV